jgi:methionyl aminopeptidase
MEDFLEPGMTTLEISRYCSKEIEKNGAASAALSLGFPGAVCTSVNSVAVHGIPGKRKLLQGDIITIDISLFSGGWFSDAAASYSIGVVSPVAERLLQSAYGATMAGISVVKPGAKTTDIGKAIYQYAHGRNLFVIPSCVGHGIGQTLHEPPVIPSTLHPGEGVMLEEGMVFTIEPVLTLKKCCLTLSEDGWSRVTSSGLPAAQWEHTVLVTEKGSLVLTQ